MSQIAAFEDVSPAPVVTRVGEGAVLYFPHFGHRIVQKVAAEATGNAFALGEVIAQPGGGVPLHVHAEEDEVFYVRQGWFIFQCGDKTIKVGPGDTVFAPRRIAHSWRCVDIGEGNLLTLIVPGNFETFLTRLATVPVPSEPAGEAMMSALCAEYGVCFGHTVPPDLAPSSFEPAYVPTMTGAFFDLGNHRGWCKLSAAQNRDGVLIAEVAVDVGGGVPLHVHTREDEAFVVMEGRFDLAIGEEQSEIGPGDIAFAPRNIPHAWRCIGESPGRLVAVVTPGANFESFVAQIAALSAAHADNTALAEIAQRHGMRFLR